MTDIPKATYSQSTEGNHNEAHKFLANNIQFLFIFTIFFDYHIFGQEFQKFLAILVTWE